MIGCLPSKWISSFSSLEFEKKELKKNKNSALDILNKLYESEKFQTWQCTTQTDEKEKLFAELSNLKCENKSLEHVDKLAIPEQLKTIFAILKVHQGFDYFGFCHPESYNREMNRLQIVFEKKVTPAPTRENFLTYFFVKKDASHKTEHEKMSCDERISLATWCTLNFLHEFKKNEGRVYNLSLGNMEIDLTQENFYFKDILEPCTTVPNDYPIFMSQIGELTEDNSTLLFLEIILVFQKMMWGVSFYYTEEENQRTYSAMKEAFEVLKQEQNIFIPWYPFEEVWRNVVFGSYPTQERFLNSCLRCPTITREKYAEALNLGEVRASPF